MQDTKFQLWLGRWQQQDAEWKATVEDGDWRLRPLGTNELASFAESCTEQMAELDSQRKGLPYVLVIRIKSDLGTRVPLFPIDDAFCTLGYFLSPDGKPGLRVTIKTEELPDVAKKVYDMFAKSSTQELASLGNCWVCKHQYVTADPIVRFCHKRTRSPLSAHFLCAVVRSVDIIGQVTGTALYINPQEKLNMPPEKVALLERASRLVHGPDAASDDPKHMANMREELHELCRDIKSTTPYRDRVRPVDIKIGAPVLRLLDSLVGSVSRPRTYQSGEEKVGRNEPCPCGSGEKFKRCCAKD